jgi:ribonucleoside-diphosphate reductase subunit M1
MNGLKRMCASSPVWVQSKIAALSDGARIAINSKCAGVERADVPTVLASLALLYPECWEMAGFAFVALWHRRRIHSLYYKMNKSKTQLSVTFLNAVRKHNPFAVYTRDYLLSYQALVTLTSRYALNEFETPQDIFLRTAISLYPHDEHAFRTVYDDMSLLRYVHATPTLVNAGKSMASYASCFLLSVQSDSIEGIYDTVRDCAIISKRGGGVGINVSNVRSALSPLRGRRACKGVLPVCKLLNETVAYVNQGGTRPGACCVYIEIWHPDLYALLDAKVATGEEGGKARNLFFALWICDIFMRRVRDGGDWSFLCPVKAAVLIDQFGERFSSTYARLERNATLCRIPARKVWSRILRTQMATGGPFIMYKNACNAFSNQRTEGVIRGSNLCTEIMQITNEQTVSVCTLASVSLPACVVRETFSYVVLERIVRQLVRNLNRTLDTQTLPLVQCEKSLRAIGIGIQGLADVFIRLGLPFTDDKSRVLNARIAEHVYFYALDESCVLAETHGAYEGFKNSPMAHGEFAFHHYPHVKRTLAWDALAERIQAHGVRNSLVTANMPTVSTSLILGNEQCFQPIYSNAVVHRTIAGEFSQINPTLVDHLRRLSLWNEHVRRKILASRGSVQRIDSLSTHTKALFRTIWEIGQRDLLDMNLDRQAFVDQSQSFSAHFEEPDEEALSNYHFYGWIRYIKTGMYYLHSLPKSNAAPVTCEMCAA